MQGLKKKLYYIVDLFVSEVKKKRGEIMASVFKRKYTKVVNGKGEKKQSQKYYTRLTDADGIKRTIPLFRDKTASEQRAAQLQKEIELARVGVIDKFKEHRKRPLAKHLEDFYQALLARGNTPEYAQTVLARAKRTVEGCKFIFWNDIQPSKVERYLSELRNNGAGISAQTFNFYLQAIRQFCKWMVQDQRADSSPVEHLKGLNVRTDRRHDRRALEPDEIRRLLEATQAAPERFGMTGYQRALLYRLAVETGLRRDELKSLKKSSFDFEDCTVTVEAGYTKNKKTAVLPLRKDTAGVLQQFLQDKLPKVQVFNVPDRTAKMIKADLDDAGIAYVDDAGRFRDFHSLRHSTGSLLAASGAHPKVVQSIMRHCDINLTMSRYTHIFRGQESEAIAGLPDLSLPSKRRQKAVATGTDDRSGEDVHDGSEELTLKLTPKSTPAAFSGCNQLATVVNEQSDFPKNDVNDNCLNAEQLGIKKASLALAGTGEKAKPTVGFEPTTTGLQNQSSTVELRWHNFFRIYSNLVPGLLFFLAATLTTTEL